MAQTSPGSEALGKNAIRPWHQAPATSYFSTAAATRPHADLSKAQTHDEFMVLLATRQPQYFRILAGAPPWKPVHGLSQVQSWSLPVPTLPWGVKPAVNSTPTATRTVAAPRALAVKPARAGGGTASLAPVKLPPPAADVSEPDISSEGSDGEASHQRPSRFDAATALVANANPCLEFDSLDAPHDAQDLQGCDGQCSSSARGKATAATARAAAATTEPVLLRSLRQVLQGPRSRQQLSQQQRRRAAVAVVAASAQEDYDPVAHLRETQEAWQASMLATQRHSRARSAAARSSISPAGAGTDSAVGNSGQELTGVAHVMIQQCTDMLGKLRCAREHSASPVAPQTLPPVEQPAGDTPAQSAVANPRTYDGGVAGPVAAEQPPGREVLSGYTGEAAGSCAQAVAALLAAPRRGSSSSLGGEEAPATRRTSGGPLSPSGSRRGSRSPEPGLSLASKTPLPLHVDDLLAAMQLDSMVARGSGGDTPAASPTPGKAGPHRSSTTRLGLVAGARSPQGVAPLRAQIALCGPQLTGSVGLMGLAVSPMASPRHTSDTVADAGSEADACTGTASRAAGHDSGSATMHLQQGEVSRPGSFRGVLEGQDAAGSEACQPVAPSPRTRSRATATEATIKWVTDCQNQTWSEDGQAQQSNHESTAAQIASEWQSSEQQGLQQDLPQQHLQQKQQQQHQQQQHELQQQPLPPGSGPPTVMHGAGPGMAHTAPVVRASSSDRRRMRVAAAASMAAAAAAAATSAFEVLHRTQPEAAPPVPQRPNMLFRSTTADKALLRPQGLHVSEGHEPPMLYRLPMTPPSASTWEPHASQRAMWAVSSSPCSPAGPQDDTTSTSTALWRPLVRPGDTAAVAAMWKPVTRSSAPRFASSAVRTVSHGTGGSTGVGGTPGALASDVWPHGKRSSMVGGALASHTGVRVDASWFNPSNHHGMGQGGAEVTDRMQRHSAGAKLSSPTSTTMTAYALARATAAMQARVP